MQYTYVCVYAYTHTNTFCHAIAHIICFAQQTSKHVSWIELNHVMLKLRALWKRAAL